MGYFDKDDNRKAWENELASLKSEREQKRGNSAADVSSAPPREKKESIKEMEKETAREILEETAKDLEEQPTAGKEKAQEKIPEKEAVKETKKETPREKEEKISEEAMKNPYRIPITYEQLEAEATGKAPVHRAPQKEPSLSKSLEMSKSNSKSR